MTCGDIRARMAAGELTDWAAYDRIAPSESWLQTALICSTIVNMLRGAKSRAVQPEDFLPRRYRQETQRQSVSVIEDKLRGWAMAHKAVVVQRESGGLASGSVVGSD